jgi:hypothetical protein
MAISVWPEKEEAVIFIANLTCLFELLYKRSFDF